MTETQQPEKVTWGGIITFNFAPEFGSCLDELEDEYDDLITEFETQQQNSRRHTFAFNPVIVRNTNDATSSKTNSSLNLPSNTSSTSSSKKSGGMKGMLSHAGFKIRRRFSSRASVERKSSLLKKKEEAQAASRLESKSLNDELGTI